MAAGRLAAGILILILAAAAAPALAGQTAYFITPTWGRLSSPPGWRFDPVDGRVWQYHWGIDIAAPMGTPVLASASGVVQYAGAYGGYGLCVYLAHDRGWSTLYAHLSRIDVPPGQRVAQGTVLGTVGTAGHSTGSHLHFEIRYRGWPVDPLQYLR